MAPTKKAPVKKTVQKKATPSKSRKTEMNMDSMETPMSESSQMVSPKRSKYFVPLLIILIAALLYINKQIFVVAMVNNSPIYRLSVVRELEKQNGKQALDGLISQKLLTQEATAKKITVSNEEVDKRLKEIDAELKKQGQSLEQFLEFQGTNKEQVKEQVKLQLMVEKLFADKIVVTDKEVSDFYTQNKDSMPKGTDEATAKKQIMDDLRSQKLSQAVQKFLEQKKAKSKITYFFTY